VKVEDTHVRELVERDIGTPIPDRRWRALREQGYGKLDPDLPGDDAALRDAVRETASAYLTLYGDEPVERGARQAQDRDPEDLDDLVRLRAQVLTLLYAHEAATDPDVIAFRRDVLGDTLLTVNEGQDSVREWIEAIPEGWQWVGALLSIRFPLDERQRDRHRQMPHPLDVLFRITEELAYQYDWRKGEATRWILTGTPPRVSAMRLSARIHYSPTSAARITMVIDPATPPDEVARAYQVMRKKYIYGGTVIRPLAKKALLLAAFSITTSDTEKPTDQVRRWSRLHPQYSYDASDPVQLGNFRRDLKQATERLMHPRLGRQRPPAR